MPANHGGAEHDYWRHQLKTTLESLGYQVEEECRVPDGSVDLHATKENKHVFLEVETGKSNVHQNIHKCAALNGMKIFFFTSQAVLAAHRDTLAQVPNARGICPADLDRLADWLR